MIDLVPATLDVVGKILLGISVLLVHRRMLKERKIDEQVLKEMKNEQMLAALGIFFIVFGYILHLSQSI